MMHSPQARCRRLPVEEGGPDRTEWGRKVREARAAHDAAQRPTVAARAEEDRPAATPVTLPLRLPIATGEALVRLAARTGCAPEVLVRELIFRAVQAGGGL